MSSAKKHEHRYINVRFPADVARRLRIYAARRDTTPPDVIRELVARVVSGVPGAAREAARRAAPAPIPARENRPAG